MLKKVHEKKWILNIKSKTAGNNGEQSCRTSWFVAFRNTMELAHNICLSHLERYRNLKDKSKDFEWSAQFMEKEGFKVRKYYFIGPE